ncbi:GNAT family N-acetyltransferase [Roseicyclus sp. F158]|uniref:GNAT family N-acetyltransferase n=1 Tax=Tropicimonas omnivorans TaxID=3075590 RepID=A0ABU3DFV5_9RHOB|nr:GNAT family N-acetyltransferase [Roseicyclus sp. F158]MDT0682438.1 GNAT family N-acetyltransferase [Roseicyclus sp. F158]
MIPEDAAGLAALHVRCFETPRPWSATEIASLARSPGAFLIGDDAAFLLGRAIAGEAELLTLAVDPALRRQGRAGALLAEFEMEARHRGAETAFLEVSERNAAARALYDASGWSEAGRRGRYYSAPDGALIDALVLTKPLSTPRARG